MTASGITVWPLTAAVFVALVSSSPVHAQVAPPGAFASLRPDQTRFLSLFRELVESNTQASNGSCTLAAERMAARMRAAGFTEAQTTVFVPDAHPDDGGLLAILPGRDAEAGAILLMAHIDVVEAPADGWDSDPYTLVQRDNYFYGRGVIDDKNQAAVWVDTLIRLKESGDTPLRTLKVALTCGEESSDSVNGAQWLMTHRREEADPAFALNEGGGGQLDAQGRPILAPGRRKDQPHLPAGSHRPRRPQLAPHARQRNLHHRSGSR